MWEKLLIAAAGAVGGVVFIPVAIKLMQSKIPDDKLLKGSIFVGEYISGRMRRLLGPRWERLETIIQAKKNIISRGLDIGADKDDKKRKERKK